VRKYNMCSDPWVFKEFFIKPPAEPKTNIVLGLDLGTNCGYSYCYIKEKQLVAPENIEMHIGQWDLSAGSYDSGALRFVRLRQFLSILKPDIIAFEDVKYTPSEKLTKFNMHSILARAATSCEFFGALKATVCTWAEENGIPCGSFPIGTIKKRATGKGNANKSDMIKACNEMFKTDYDPVNYESAGFDNAADSAFVCLLALENYAKGLSFAEPKDDSAED
jgi:Holliday junction resolvasome RuvABC endonuclease subunit